MEKVYRLLARQIIEDYRIERGICVEIGSGDGKLGLELAKLTELHVYMVDIDGNALKGALRNALGANLSDRITAILARAERLPFMECSADLVVSRGSIFFWEDRPGGLKEIHRILKPGGVAFVGGGLSRYVSEGERRGFIKARMAALKDEESRREWMRLRSPQYFREILRQAGIKDFKLIVDPPGIWVEIWKR